MTINGNTKITGIIGYLISHTLSPIMHNRAFQHYNLNYIYLPFNLPKESLKSFMDIFRAIDNFVGLNVTIPYKEEVLKYLDDVDENVKYIRAVNTVLKTNKKIIGYNTDFSGFITPLEKVMNIRGKSAVLLGAGGAARAIAFALIKKKIKSIWIYDVVKEKSKKLATDMKKLGHNSKITCISYTDIPKSIKAADILINATPVGMKRTDDVIVKKEYLHKNLLVYDIVYNRKTELLKFAEEKNIKTISGVEMFIHQGAEAFRLWTGMNPPIKLMLESVKKYLRID